MNFLEKKRSFPVLVLGLFSLLVFPGADGARQVPLDMYVVIDGSTALGDARQEALNWLSEEILDKILQDGDRLSVWLAAGQAELVFSDTLRGPEGRESLKERLRTLAFSAKRADFAGAIREITARSGGGQGLPPYTILIAASGGLSPLMEESVGRFLRYSRVEEFAGWRAIRAAPGIEEQVRQAAAAYFGPGN